MGQYGYRGALFVLSQYDQPRPFQKGDHQKFMLHLFIYIEAIFDCESMPKHADVKVVSKVYNI